MGTTGWRTLRTVAAIVFCLLLAHGESRAQPVPYRPLVFVPGILGSELIDADGKLVWGGAQSLSRFKDLEITDQGPVKPLHVGGLVRSIGILGPFWTIHQYDGLLKTLHDIGFRDGETLFVFPYDWRYSNFDTAQKLQAFIDAQPALAHGGFDILAHSMGGVVSRIYLQELAGDVRVERFISLAVPAQGSMNAFATMSDGWGEFQNVLAGGIDAIRRVVFSFPSIFELFPSYENCCRIGDELKYTSFDPTDVVVWKASNWIPAEHRGARLALLEQALGNAQRVRPLMRKPLPGQTAATLIAGDRFATNLYLYVDPANRSWTRWRFSKSRGDGTVPLWSAANANLGDSLPAFVDHATIFDDKWIINKLQRMLDKNGGPPPVAATSNPLAITSSGRAVEIDLLDATLDPPVMIAGKQARLTVSLALVDEVAREDLAPKLVLIGPSDERTLTSTNTTTSADLDQRTLRFVAEVDAKEPGPYAIRIDVPGLGTYTRDLLVLDRQ